MCKQHEEKIKALKERLSQLFLEDALYSRGFNCVGEPDKIPDPERSICQSVAKDWAELIAMITPEVIDEVIDGKE